MEDIMEKVITNSNFHEEVENAALPVMIDFYADWCGPCQMMAPIVEKLSDEYEGKMIVGKCNVDEQEELASKFGVMSIPTILILKGGQVVMKSVGGVSQGELEDKIKAAIG
ncbi:MAG: thioredoxin [Lachnospiraceae bacterium]|jgi:thioredoxin 1|nr:thioredoxin [Lachnospiraceae bacterium]